MTTAPTSILGKTIYTAVGIALGVIASLTFFFVASAKNRTELPKLQSLDLSISTPTDFLTTDKKTITISGTTGIESVVTINSSQTNTVIQTSNGKFSTKLDLVEGKNLLSITAFDPKTGSSQVKTKEILYLDEDLTSL